jgi:predicted ATP-binding protein involved in virulence|nr:MAG TPA: putative ATP-binding protein [Caudoviricetes sp.]
MQKKNHIPFLAYICENNSRISFMAIEDIPVYIRSLILRNYKCFKNENVFSFCKDSNKRKLAQCTVILGDNGTGKTNILKAIANLEPILDEVKNVDATEGVYADMAIVLGSEVLSPDLSKEPMYRPRVVERYDCEIQYGVECNFLKVNNLRRSIDKSSYSELIRYETAFPMDGKSYKSKSQIKYGYTQRVNYVDPTKNLKNVKIDAYGTSRHSKYGSKRLENQLNSESLFYDDNRLIDIESWILQLDTAKQHGRPGASNRYLRVRNMIRQSQLFPDVKDIEIGFDENENSFVYFITDNGKYRLQELGYGYQCMFSWIFDFCKKMFDRYPKSQNPLHEPAILLVDEIDMHLHPLWQRIVLSELCKMFPMTQFIVTTHSPLLVQSIEKINLYVLFNKSGEAEIKHYPNVSFQGWTVEEILSELMGLGDEVRSDKYQYLISQMQDSLQNGDVKRASKVFSELSDILHPNSIDREILSMQIEAIHDHD